MAGRRARQGTVGVPLKVSDALQAEVGAASASAESPNAAAEPNVVELPSVAAAAAREGAGARFLSAVSAGGPEATPPGAWQGGGDSLHRRPPGHVQRRCAVTPPEEVLTRATFNARVAAAARLLQASRDRGGATDTRAWQGAGAADTRDPPAGGEAQLTDEQFEIAREWFQHQFKLSWEADDPATAPRRPGEKARAYRTRLRAAFRARSAERTFCRLCPRARYFSASVGRPINFYRSHGL